MEPNIAHTPRVLVVENNPEVLDLITAMVTSLDCDALSAASVEEARHILAQGPIDALITDLVLGDGDGLELIREMRARGDEAPALMIFSYASPELQSTARRAGAVDLLAKPFRLERLSQVLVQVLKSCNPSAVSTH